MEEAYQYDCANPEFEELARVISDLFPEQTQFIQRAGEDGTPTLAIHWVAMRFGATARRIVMTVVIAPTALARYRALPARLRGRSSPCCGRMSKRASARSKNSMRTAKRWRAM